MLSIFSIGDLIVLLVVAGALIAYRQMDKNSRSIQVVKRYIEHSAQRFEAYVEEHITELREMDSYLKTKEKHARDLIVEMDAILQDIEGHADDVFLLKEAMEKYDQVLIDLSNATQQVDVNIERIVGMRDEIVNETKRTFHEISHTVMALESRVEGIKGEIEAQPYMQDETNTMYTQAVSSSRKANHVAPAVTVARPKSSLVETSVQNQQPPRAQEPAVDGHSFTLEAPATNTATTNTAPVARPAATTNSATTLEPAKPAQTVAVAQQTIPTTSETAQVAAYQQAAAAQLGVESFTPPGGKPLATPQRATAPAQEAPREQDRITPKQVQRSGEDTRSQIIRLRKQGLGVGEIARNLSIPAGEVELVLGLLDEQHVGFAGSPSYASIGK